MRLFIDSANLADIESALDRGLVSGVTTNPSIMAKNDVTVQQIIDLIRSFGDDIPLSVEVTSSNPDIIMSQAIDWQKAYAYNELYVKVPIGWDELQVVRQLRHEGIPVNVTACMTYTQAIAAANAGANYVSLFWGRIRDGGETPANVVYQVRTTFKEWGCPSQIIVGSIRSIYDVAEALQSGADIVTVPAQFLPLLCQHPQTDKVVAQFLQDAAASQRGNQ